ncbi:MAG: PIN domain-containing protein [Acidimicrobiia bacterium]
MRLVVDTNVLVGDLLRAAGRRRLADDRIELFLPAPMWDEAQVELPRRLRAFARRHGLSEDAESALLRSLLEAIEANVAIVDEAVCAAAEEEARARSLRDPDDWPLVACALVLDAAVWTHDGDLLGTGVATWTTATLEGWLDRNPAGQ